MDVGILISTVRVGMMAKQRLLQMQREGMPGEEDGAAYRQGPHLVWGDVCGEAQLRQHRATA